MRGKPNVQVLDLRIASQTENGFIHAALPDSGVKGSTDSLACRPDDPSKPQPYSPRQANPSKIQPSTQPTPAMTAAAPSSSAISPRLGLETAASTHKPPAAR